MKKEITEIKTKERTSFRPSHVKTLLCWRKKKTWRNTQQVFDQKGARQANKPPKEILSRVKKDHFDHTWQDKIQQKN